MMLRKPWIPLLCGLAALVAVEAASAQAFDAVRLYGAPAADGEGTVGVAVVQGRQYLGSDQGRTLLFPVLDYRWSNGWFAGTTNGVGYVFDSAPNVQYGLRITADLGRSEDRSQALRGLGDIRWRPEFGGFMNLYLSPEVFLTSSLRYGQGRQSDGALLDLGAGYATQLAPRWRAAAGVAATLANGSYMQDYFGITPAQAQTSAYLPYRAAAGLRDVRANGSLTYFISPFWTVTAALSMDSMQGDARTSPLVRDRYPVTGVAAVSYRF